MYAILKDGQIIPEEDIIVWAKWYECADDRIIEQTHVGEAFVSTVFLGCDHAMPGGRPQWFETMIFRGDLNNTQERYATLEEAQAGHRRWVDEARLVQFMHAPLPNVETT